MLSSSAFPSCPPVGHTQLGRVPKARRNRGGRSVAVAHSPVAQSALSASRAPPLRRAALITRASSSGFGSLTASLEQAWGKLKFQEALTGASRATAVLTRSGIALTPLPPRHHHLQPRT